jgi:hypothetical protein
MCECKQYACLNVHFLTFVGYTDMKANLPASHHSGLGTVPGQFMWDLWWTKWLWGELNQGRFKVCVNSD